MAALAEIRIPRITNWELKLAEHIRPLARFSLSLGNLKVDPKGEAYYVAFDNPRGVLTSQDPKPETMVKGLSRFFDLVTYHSYTNPSLFEPTWAEVVAQIPVELRHIVCAFEFIGRATRVGRFHSVTTRLYKSRVRP